MKIALVRYRYSSHGGAERYLDMLAAGLQASGAQVRVLSSSWEGENIARLPWEKLSVPRRPVPLRLWLFPSAWLALKYLNSLLKASASASEESWGSRVLR